MVLSINTLQELAQDTAGGRIASLRLLAQGSTYLGPQASWPRGACALFLFDIVLIMGGQLDTLLFESD